MSDSHDLADPLLALFKEDVQDAASTLVKAFSGLLVDCKHPTPLEPLEQAARLMKAAALIVGHSEVAELARGIEERLAMYRAGVPWDQDSVQTIFDAVNWAKQLAAGSDPDYDPKLTEKLITRLRAARPAATTVPSPPVAPEAPEPNPAPGVEPQASPRPVAAPAPPTPKDAQAQALMELFREEMRSLCQSLSTGLVELEASASDPRKIEPLMRAAHSIKGAARIVDCEPAVDLAHVMEELLVLAQTGKRTLQAAEVDVLLQAVDLLAELADADIAAWSVHNQARAAGIAQQLQAAIDGTPLPTIVSTAADFSADQAPPPWAETVQPSSPGTPSAVPTAATVTAAQALPSAPTASGVSAALTASGVSAAAPTNPSTPTVAPVLEHGLSPSEAKERVVRVSAISLTRLLSLAGESLVEARWLQPFAHSLMKLKKYQDYLADVLEELQRQENQHGTERGQRLTEEARQQLSGCRQLLAERIDEFEVHARRSDDLNSRLYREVIASRMRPFADGTQGFSRMVRDVARQLGKQVQFEVLGQDTDVDRDILDKLDAPLGHLLRNALDHGLETPEERRAAGKPETGRIRLEARHHAGVLNITIQDDGRGIDKDRLRAKIIERKLISADLAAKLSDAELYDFLFLPGFSTAEKVTNVSGRGVGLDVVQAMAQAVGGTIRVTSKLGRGTTFELNLPITLSVLRAVLVRISGDPYALPLNRADRLLKLPADSINTLEGKPHIDVDGRNIGVVPAHLVLELPPGKTHSDEQCVVLFGDRTQQYGLLVEQFLGEQDLVVRPLDTRLGKVPNISAAALLEDGSPVLIIDVDDVIRSAANLVQEGRLRHQRVNKQESAKRRKRILVVDDSAIVREVERQMLQARGYEVDVAVDGVDGWNALRAGGYDLVVSDVDMPRMTGLELIRAIRAEPKLQSTPVVIVSYKDRSDDRERGLEAGANYYLTKSSFHDGRFLAAVEELIGGPVE